MPEWTQHAALGSRKAQATECPSAGEWTASGQAVVSHVSPGRGIVLRHKNRALTQAATGMNRHT